MKLQEFSGVDWKKFRNIARFLSKITQKHEIPTPPVAGRQPGNQRYQKRRSLEKSPRPKAAVSALKSLKL
jgi:hypothetical protein